MDFLLAFLGSGVGAVLVGILGKEWLAVRLAAEIQKEVAIQKAAFEVKIGACLDALSVVDAYFSTLDWKGTLQPEVQELSTQKARECYNKLALTCENPKVIEAFSNALCLRSLGEKPKIVSADAILDLRNLMRQELGFGKVLDLPREKAWISRLQK